MELFPRDLESERCWRSLRRFVIWYGVGVLALSGTVIHYILTHALPVELLEPKGRWVSYQQLDPEVRAVLSLDHHDWMMPMGANTLKCTVQVMQWTLDKAHIGDLSASRSELAYFPEPWRVRLEELLVLRGERVLERMALENKISQQRYEELQAYLRAIDEQSELKRLRVELGYEL